MPKPKEVFDNPRKYWDFITASSDDEFEGQHFDRKELPHPENNGFINKNKLRKFQKEKVRVTISAFANLSVDGGLLIIGVSTVGEIKGINFLKEEQINQLTSFTDLLRNQAAQTEFFECENKKGNLDKILLIYVPCYPNAICETIENHPKAWIRSGTQNLPMSNDLKEQIKRDKRITDFENTYCTPFNLEDIDKDVLEEFRKEFLADTSYEYSDEELLLEAGAIIRDGDGYAFTNAGFLFFSRNPQRHFSWAYVRVLRFDENNDDTRGDSTLDRKFDGSIAQQIRKIQTFFRESGYFKVYQKRDHNGKFIEDPEFPYDTLDEAIVNSVAHRDYGIQLPIECIHYNDSLIVENPGYIKQRDKELPPQFTLKDIVLDSRPRNPKLMEWLKLIKFVRALSEGTRRIKDEMVKANLPTPKYDTNQTRTILELYNNSIEREKRSKEFNKLSKVNSEENPDPTEYINLFPLNFLNQSGLKIDIKIMRGYRKTFMFYLRDALDANGWYIDRFKFNKIIAHRKGSDIKLPQEVNKLIRFYPAYVMQLREHFKRFFLCIDYTLEVKNIQTVRTLLNTLTQDELINNKCIVHLDNWYRGRILTANKEVTNVLVFDFEDEKIIDSSKVIPDLNFNTIKSILKKKSVSFDLSKEIKKHSLSIKTGQARTRAKKCINTAREIANSIFPLKIDNWKALMYATPEPLYGLHESFPAYNKKFHFYTLSEPEVEFWRDHETSDIREGITKFGSYDKENKTIELIPICKDSMRDKMANLIKRLKNGAYKYRGSERTFHTRFTYNSIITTPDTKNILKECKRLLEEHPDWKGNKNLDRLFLVQTPEKEYSLDDENSPYYVVKRFLFENGIPCQMVNTPTLFNPDWKDLNLALDIAAKCGITPWLLPDQIPNADFFIGFSYTQNKNDTKQRYVGYATVFNSFGRWEFYSGSSDVFSYEDRTKYFAELTKDTLKRLSLSETPNIYFHYSAKFSKDDRAAILKAARVIKPKGIYSFVSINTHHNIRLYDKSPETDGSLRRGSFVITSPKQILLSTTGYNPYRKVLGTPKPLEITIWTEKPDGYTEKNPDLKALAVQILSLTKLNWASTESLCSEPITTKYAHEIAYLTAAFLRQNDSFKLHPVLEKTPWFI